MKVKVIFIVCSCDVNIFASSKRSQTLIVMQPVNGESAAVNTEDSPVRRLHWTTKAELMNFTGRLALQQEAGFFHLKSPLITTYHLQCVFVTFSRRTRSCLQFLTLTFCVSRVPDCLMTHDKVTHCYGATSGRISAAAGTGLKPPSLAPAPSGPVIRNKRLKRTTSSSFSHWWYSGVRCLYRCGLQVPWPRPLSSSGGDGDGDSGRSGNILLLHILSPCFSITGLFGCSREAATCQ